MFHEIPFLGGFASMLVWVFLYLCTVPTAILLVWSLVPAWRASFHRADWWIVVSGPLAWIACFVVLLPARSMGNFIESLVVQCLITVLILLLIVIRSQRWAWYRSIYGILASGMIGVAVRVLTPTLPQ